MDARFITGTLPTEHQRLRMQVWSAAFCGVAAAFNSQMDDAVKWADYALEQFDERFTQK